MYLIKQIVAHNKGRWLHKTFPAIPLQESSNIKLNDAGNGKPLRILSEETGSLAAQQVYRN